MNPSSRPEPGCAPRAVLVTVVIPVFNADEARVQRAIESACGQRHRHLEVIVVDDGSEPTHATFLDRLAALDQRLHVIHQANAGVSAARNRGMKAAAGEYVCFLDADDYLASDFIESALMLITAFSLSAVFGGVRVLDEAGCVRWRWVPEPGTHLRLLTAAELDEVRGSALSSSPDPRQYGELTLVTNVHGGVYETSAARRAGFVEGVSQGEDRVFNVDVLGFAATVGFCSSAWYVYDRTGGQGVTQRLDASVALKFGGTMQAFARAALLLPGEPIRPPTLLQRAAAQGILNYVKAAVLILGATHDRARATNHLASLTALECVQTAARMQITLGPVDRVVACLVRGRHLATLLALGTVWARKQGLGHG